MTVRDGGVAALLARLFELDVKLWAEGEELVISAPRGVLDAELRAALTARKPEILALLRDGMGSTRPDALPALVARPEERDQPFPLTDIQQAYWVGRGGELELGTAIHVYVEIDSETLDPARFGQVWQRLIDRHEMLRAVALPDGTQRILPEVPAYEIEVEDLRGLPATEIEQRMSVHRQRLAHQILPLDVWPLFEIRAARLDRGYRLFFSIDCTFVDSWSLQVIFRELIQLYGDPSSRLDPEVHTQSFRDYVLAAGRLRETDLYKRSQAYWQERVATLPPAPELPMVRRAHMPKWPRFERRVARVDQAQWERLSARAREIQLTPTGLLLAAYAEVLGCFSKSPHFTLNVPLYNRLPLHPDVGKMVGTFSSFLLLEVDQRAGKSFLERARALQAQLFRDLEHRYIGGVEVLRQLFRRRGKISGALMPVVLTSFASNVEGWDSCWVDHLGRFFGHVVHSVTQTPQVWIDHQIVFQDGGLFFNWDAAEDLFPPGLLDDMFAAYCGLLDRLASDDRVLHEQPLRLVPAACAAGPARAETAAAVGTETTTEAGRGGLLHSRFCDQARAQPEHPAVIAPGRTLSYGALLGRAAGLARALVARGARRNQPVAVVMDKGWEQVVAALAASMAGAPYLPIDAALPRERVWHLLADSGCGLVLSQPWHAAGLDWPQDLQVLAVDDSEAHILADPAVSAPVEGPDGLPDDLAVIIYTSGSTGQPNGAMLAHRGLVHALDETIRAFDIGPADRVLALTALHHDMSIFDLFGMLSAGGTIVFCEAEARREPARWAELMHQHRVTVWNSVPGMMAMLLAHLDGVASGPASGQTSNQARGLPDSLRLAFLGGDWIPLELPARLRGLVPGMEVVSVGGPTETSLWNIWYRIGEVDPDWTSIPYGRPIADTRYYVMDEGLRERPVWVPGELCVAGVGLARGYWNNEERTRAKFVTHPVTGERLYRTGDLGRLLPDGNIEILGRVDFQLSILGHRVEPGEIEAALQRHPDVAGAVVTADGNRHAPRLLAYVVCKPGQTASMSASADALQAFLRGKLADHMVPSVFVFLERFPLGPTGKVDRAALPPPHADGADDRAAQAPSDRDDASEAAGASDTEDAVAAIVKEVLGLARIGRQTNFFELGANSVHLVQVNARIRQTLGAELPMVEIFQNANVAALAGFIARQRGGQGDGPSARVQAAGASSLERSPIAIIGMSARMPGAPDVDTLWDNLVSGVESVRFFTDEELLADGLPRDMLSDPRYVKAGAVLDDIAGFDAGLFGLSAREAQLTDPQQRLFLECVWEVLERAGYCPTGSERKIGVYAGKSISNYIYPELDLTEPLAYFQRLFGNDKDFIATQVSYKLGLTGPSITLQTACSTSLVAVVLACQALWNRDCEMALAGGVSIKVPHHLGYLAEPGAGMFSPDGHCRPFDAKAQGIVPGSGGGVVLLKRLDDALADGDHVHAVILGAAVNNDGGIKAGFSAPNRDGQAEVIARAQAMAGVDPATIRYVETHGTGTPMGDPIEIAALTQAFRLGTDERGFCAVGSIKSNFGHLDTGAGVAGLVKAVLTVEKGVIPPTINFESPNPAIDFDSTPFFVNAALRDWPNTGGTGGARDVEGPRRAGVSSFGVGGTNAHVILEQAPARPARAAATAPQRPVHLLPLSARSEAALDALARRFEDHLARNPGADVADIGYTAVVGRAHLSHRLAVVGRDATEMRERLAAMRTSGGEIAGLVRGRFEDETAPRIGFLFTGHGPQHAGMGRGLFDAQPVFRQAMEQVDALLRGDLDVPLIDVLYGSQQQRMGDLVYAQVALFALEYALAAMWRSWGIEPAAVLGHSLGEYAAATVAGVLDLPDALRLVLGRVRLIEELGREGETVVVLAEEARVREAMEPHGARLSVASINGPANIVVSGDTEAVRALMATLADAGVQVKRLEVKRAAHSPLMDPVLPAFEQVARAASFRAARVDLVSNLSGRVAGAEVAMPGYWVRHLREPVQLAEGMRTMLACGVRAFVELGPKPTLLWMGRECLPDADALWVPSLRKGYDDWERALESLGALHAHGARVRWDGFEQGQTRSRVVLPTYPFERQRYWSEEAGPRAVTARSAVAAAKRGPASRGAHPLLGERVRSAALRPGELLFESRLGARSPAYLSDHRVSGTALLPGTAYLEMALAAGARVMPGKPLVLEDVALEQAMLLPAEGTATVQMMLRVAPSDGGAANAGNGGARSFEVFSLQEDAGAADGADATWIRHASGGLREARPGDPAAEGAAPAVLQAPAAGQVSGAEHYAQVFARGDEFGESFRGLVALWRDRDGALGRIARPQSLGEVDDGMGGDPSGHGFHPAVLDACLHVVSACYPDLEDGEVVLPVGVARVIPRCAALPARMVSRAVMRAPLVADVLVYSEAGEELLRFEGLALRRVRRDVLVPRTAPGDDEQWLYEPVWREQALPAGAPSAHAADLAGAAPWLILADRHGVGDALAAQVRASGGVCAIARPAAGYERQGTERFVLDPRQPAHFARLLAAWTESGNAPFGRVVHLWSLDVESSAPGASGNAGLASADAVEEGALFACGSALHMAQALVQQAGDARAALDLITCNAWPESRPGSGRPTASAAWQLAAPTAGDLPDSDSASALESESVSVSDSVSGSGSESGPGAWNGAPATLWGLGSVLDVEHPELSCRRVELVALHAWDSPGNDAQDQKDAVQAAAAALLAELIAASDAPGAGDSGQGREDQVRLARARRQVARLQPVTLPARASGLRADASYLITGAHGRLGQLVARAMVDQGARHLVLVSRRAVVDDAPALEVLRALGAHLTVARADVARADDLARVLADTRRAGPPLRGVVHAAGAIDDALVPDQSWEHLARVFDAKVRGAWNLHLQTQADDLDFFVLFSSVASVLGTAGQANYAAANAFLDALAAHRRALGRAALSIAWGPWADAGAAADERARERLARQGLGTIPPERGVAILGRLWSHAHARVCVAPVDWSLFGRTSSSRLHAEVAGQGAHASRSPAAASGPAASLASRLEAVPTAERRALLRAHVREQVAAVLGLAADAVDTRRGLFDLGLDSLGALEVRNRLQKSAGRALPSTLVFNHPSVDELVVHLAGAVLGIALDAGPDATPGTTPDAASDTAPGEAELQAEDASNLDALSLQELAARLQSKLEEMDG